MIALAAFLVLFGLAASASAGVWLALWLTYAGVVDGRPGVVAVGLALLALAEVRARAS